MVLTCLEFLKTGKESLGKITENISCYTANHCHKDITKVLVPAINL